MEMWSEMTGIPEFRPPPGSKGQDLSLLNRLRCMASTVEQKRKNVWNKRYFLLVSFLQRQLSPLK